MFRSVKQKNMFTTGRFGIGFKSSFHFTNTPFVVSGQQAVVFDPALTIDDENAQFVSSDFPADHAANRLPAPLVAFFRQVANIHGFDPSRRFEGTLVVLPFRDQALKRSPSHAASALSTPQGRKAENDRKRKTQLVEDFLQDQRLQDIIFCTAAKMREFFDRFAVLVPPPINRFGSGETETETELQRALLFLKNVRRVEFWQLQDPGSNDGDDGDDDGRVFIRSASVQEHAAVVDEQGSVEVWNALMEQENAEDGEGETENANAIINRYVETLQREQVCFLIIPICSSKRSIFYLHIRIHAPTNTHTHTCIHI